MTHTKAPRATDDERKERRRAANRRSARKSRYKENVLLDELQRTVEELAKKNMALKSENDSFRQDVQALQGIIMLKNGQQELDVKKVSPLRHHSSCNTGGGIQNILAMQSSLKQQQPLSLDDVASTHQESLSLDIGRTPSPVSSYNLTQLDPDRIFPVENDKEAPMMQQNFAMMRAASSLFRATYQAA